MAGKGVSYMKWKKTSGRCFVTALSSALLEWLLILMLLMNGLFSYLITCFARYCDLPLPCLLCSRLDHVFGSQRVGSCWDLMCKTHKSEISSLVMCTLHQKLVDVHGVCENCLFSFATKDKSNPETYRLLVGKLGIDDSPLHGDDHQKPMKVCCCCNEPWSFRNQAQVLVKKKSVEIERDDVVDSDLTRELGLNWSSTNKEKRPFFFAARSDLHESFEDCSPHFEYSELKLNSDSESDDNEINHSHKHLVASLQSPNLIDHEESQSDLVKSRDMQSEISTVPDSTLTETPNLIDDWMKPQEDAIPEPSNLVDHELSHSDLIESNEKAPSALSDPVGHGLEELNWQDIDLKVESSPLISTNSVPVSPNSEEIPADPSKDHVVSDQKDTETSVQVEQISRAKSIEKPNEPEKEDTTTDVLNTNLINGHGMEELNWQDIDLKIESSPDSDQTSDDVIPESPNAAEIQVDPPKDDVASDLKDTDQVPLEVEQIPRAQSMESVNQPEKEHDVVNSKVINGVNDGGVQVQVQVQVQPTNNLELSDAYKLAVSSRGRQLSGKTLEQFLGRDSTKVSEDLKLLLSQLSLARGLDLPLTGMMSPRISANMEDSKALDSLALIGMQLLQKRISLERNDSRNSVESLDISTVSDIDGESEMEKLKRQIEHDKKFMNALYKELEEERNASAVAANQALAMITRLQEEKAALQMEALHDIRMMEDQAEYDVEALERANELLTEKEKEIQDLEAELDYYRLKYPDDELMLENEELILNQNQGSLLGFEDERVNISQRLSNLEKKLHLFSSTGVYPDMEEEKKDNHNVLLQKRNSASFGVRRSLVRRVNSLKTPRTVIGQDSLVNTEGDIVSLGSEVSTLNERLQALEADRNFIEHAVNSLRNGEEGVRFIREIASHLQELRRVGIKRKQSLA